MTTSTRLAAIAAHDVMINRTVAVSPEAIQEALETIYSVPTSLPS